MQSGFYVRFMMNIFVYELPIQKAIWQNGKGNVFYLGSIKSFLHLLQKKFQLMTHLPLSVCHSLVPFGINM